MNCVSYLAGKQNNTRALLSINTLKFKLKTE